MRSVLSGATGSGDGLTLSFGSPASGDILSIEKGLFRSRNDHAGPATATPTPVLLFDPSLAQKSLRSQSVLSWQGIQEHVSKVTTDAAWSMAMPADLVVLRRPSLLVLLREPSVRGADAAA